MRFLPSTAQTGEVDAGSCEIERIRTEYERRKRDIPRDFYSWSRPANCFHHTHLVRDCIAELARESMFPLENRGVADIGCGTGKWLLEFAQWDATDLHGIDLDETRIRLAKQRLPSADLQAGDARSLPWPDNSFDLVSQFTLFTSILDAAVKRQIAREMLRVAKPNGLILWFDFRFDNPRNNRVKGIASGEIHQLFPRCSMRLERVTLAPPVARMIVPLSWIAASVLEKIPVLRTHYLGVIRKTADWSAPGPAGVRSQTNG